MDAQAIVEERLANLDANRRRWLTWPNPRCRLQLGPVERNDFYGGVDAIFAIGQRFGLATVFEHEGELWASDVWWLPSGRASASVKIRRSAIRAVVVQRHNRRRGGR